MLDPDKLRATYDRISLRVTPGVKALFEALAKREGIKATKLFERWVFAESEKSTRTPKKIARKG